MVGSIFINLNIVSMCTMLIVNYSSSSVPMCAQRSQNNNIFIAFIAVQFEYKHVWTTFHNYLFILYLMGLVGTFFRIQQHWGKPFKRLQLPFKFITIYRYKWKNPYSFWRSNIFCTYLYFICWHVHVIVTKHSYTIRRKKKEKKSP